nr:uncharacterized protein LOC109185195 [Ipomoea batatas]
MYEVSCDTASQAKMEALGLEVRRLQAQMEKMNKAQRGNTCMTLALYCDKCGGAHGTHECTSTYDDGSYEQVDAVGYQRPNDFNSYGNNNSQNWRQGQAVTLRSGRELPEPILKKSTNSKSPIEEVTVEEVLEEEEAKEKGDSPLPTSPKVTQALRKQKTKRMCLYDTCYFVDIFHEHVESVYSNFLGKVKNDTHLKELCDDVDFESLALVDNSLTRKHDSDMHEILCIDDETNVDDKEEMEGDVRDVLLTKEKEGEKENGSEDATLDARLDARPGPRPTTKLQKPEDATLDAGLDARPSVGTEPWTRFWAF